MRRLCIAAAAFALLASGCGSSGGRSPNESATLVLDFTPNAVHAGIYLALERDYTGAEGVDLHVREPSSSTDSVKLLAAGRARFAILDIHDLAIARAKGEDVVGVLALVERPLAAVLAQPGIRTPRDLEGRRAGVTGLPSDDAVLSSVVAGAGGNPRKVRRITIGFDAVPALLARRVDAATAFWNAEGVALRDKRPGLREFRVDEYGAPAYPELVLCATGATVRHDPALVRSTVHALVRGYDEALTDPESAASALETRVPGLDRRLVSQELDALAGAFEGSEPRFGVLDPGALRAWARWEAKFGIVKRPPDVAAMFDDRFVPR
jgi:putative hydroxymethylpyrimidine transport system substrate-binding protein